MIAATTEFQNLMKQPEKTIRVRAYSYGIGEEVTDVVEVWANDLVSVSIDSIGAFLGAAGRMATAQVYTDQSPIIGSVLRLDLEVKNPDHTWETIELGNFSVYQVEFNVESQMSKVTLYDKMMMLSTVEYALTDDQFPMTVQELATQMTDYADITLDTNFENLPNADYSITENLWKTIQNTTYRDVVQQIAEVTGTTAVVSGNELLFRKYTTSLSEINENNLIGFRMGQKWGNVNSVSLSRMPQNDNIVLANDANIEANGAFETTIINNQIVDDDRTTLIQPLYDALVGETPYITFYDSEFTTEGHGWYEVGDLITATLSEIEYPIFVTEHHLLIDKGIKETIKSIIPTNPAVNRTSAGGILRSLWNTELKVDKQNNEITSIVSRQDQYETTTQENYTEVIQTIDQISSTIQDGGGMNQIYNSVGYSEENGEFNAWTIDDTTVTSRSDTSPFPAGAISGSTLDLTGAGTFTQRVIVNPGGTYSLSFYARKETQGVVTVSATNDLDNFSVTFDDDTSYDWKKFRVADTVNGTTYIQPTSNYLDITFTLDADVTLFSFTDLVMVRGIADKGWTQAVGEVANTNVTFDTKGITVKKTDPEGNYTNAKTVMTPLEFAGYDDSGQRAFYLNNDTTQVNNLRIGGADEDDNNLEGYTGAIETPEILIISLSSGPNAGMNFVVKG